MAKWSMAPSRRSLALVTALCGRSRTFWTFYTIGIVCVAGLAATCLTAFTGAPLHISAAVSDVLHWRRSARRVHEECAAAVARLTDDDKSTCEEAPNPWQHESYLSAFVKPTVMQPLWRCQQLNFIQSMAASSSSARSGAQAGACDVARRLSEHGLSVNSLGLDFKQVFDNCDGNEYGCDARMQDLVQLARVYQADFGDGSCPNCVDIVVKDHELRLRQRPMGLLVEGQRDRFQQFFRDGFTQFKDLGVNIDALRREVDENLANLPKKQLAAGGARGFMSAVVKLDNLDTILRDSSIMQLASFYLGSTVTVAGYKILRLDKTVSTDKYISGHWHNDGCGSRLKLFVYLDDVAENGHPTEIARGSQTTAYYNYGYANSLYTRYSTQYVGNEFEVVPMLGVRGGGFMFDTNTVHRGNVDGTQLVRDTIIIDIESLEKLQHKPKLGGRIGCPDVDLYPVGTNFPLPEEAVA